MWTNLEAKVLGGPTATSTMLGDTGLALLVPEMLVFGGDTWIVVQVMANRKLTRASLLKSE